MKVTKEILGEFYDISRKAAYGDELTASEQSRLSEITDAAFSILKVSINNSIVLNGDQITYTATRILSGNAAGVGKGGRFDGAGFLKVRNFTKKKIEYAEVTVDKDLFSKYLQRQINSAESADDRWNRIYADTSARVNKWLLTRIQTVGASQQISLIDVPSPMAKLKEKLTPPALAAVNEATDVFNQYQALRSELANTLSREIKGVIINADDFLLITHNADETLLCFEITERLNLAALNSLRDILGITDITVGPSHLEGGQVNIMVKWSY
jgi:hypothetical protein